MQGSRTHHCPDALPDEEQAPLVMRPTPDRAGGARLVIPESAQRVAVICPTLRAVDVCTHPGLVLLDLSGCEAGIYVRLIGDQMPERIVVPNAGGGAVLVASLEAPPLALRVDGPVCTINLAWKEAGVSRSIWVRTRRRAPPFQNAFVGPPRHWKPGAEVAVLVGGPLLGAQINAATMGVRALYVVGDRCGVQLRVRGAIAHLTLLDSTVERIRAEEVTYLRAERCPNLRELTATGQHCTVVGGCDVDLLDITGFWNSLDLHDIELRRLRIPAAGWLNLRNVPQLASVETLAVALDGAPAVRTQIDGRFAPKVVGRGAVEVRPMTVDDICAVFAEGESPAAEGMFQWACLHPRPAEMWLALQVLKSAVDANRDRPGIASDAWQGRCKLMSRSRSTARGRVSPEQQAGLSAQPGGASSHGANSDGANSDGANHHGAEPNDAHPWWWRLPGDLADRGWTADVALWLSCFAARDPDAMAFSQVMTRCHRPVHIATLLHHAAHERVTVDERRLLLLVAEGCMTHGVVTGFRLDVDESTGRPNAGISCLTPDTVTLLQRALKAILCGLKNHAEFARPTTLFSRYLGLCVPTLEGVALLGVLRVAGVPTAETMLIGVQNLGGSRVEPNPSRQLALRGAVLQELMRSVKTAAPDRGGPSTRLGP